MIQIRTRKIDLAKFLHHANVSDFLNVIYRKCGTDKKTAIHLLRYCESLRTERNQLRTSGHLDLDKLLTTKEDFEKTSKWMIQHAGIGQFRLANTLLYEQEEQE